jgi:hypothetical protein
MQERSSRLEFKPLRRPVRMRGPQARDSKLDSSLVQAGDHFEFLRWRHALESLDLDRVERFEHDRGHLTPALLERQIREELDAKAQRKH